MPLDGFGVDTVIVDEVARHLVLVPEPKLTAWTLMNAHGALPGVHPPGYDRREPPQGSR